MDRDEAFEALRAADPTRMSLDIEAMRNLVVTGHHEHRAPRTRFAVAAATVIALTVGATSGYQVAASRTTTAGTALSAVVPPSPGSEPGDGEVAVTGADKMATYLPAGRVILRPASSLPDTSTSRVGYTLTGKVDRKAALQRLADRFSLGSVAKSPDGSYTAGDPQATSAAIGTDPAASWWYNDPSNSPWNCATSAQQQTCAPISGDPLSDGAAIAAAKDLFGALGLAADQAQWSVADASWFGTGPDNKPVPFRHVSAELTLGGLRTGMVWTTDLAPDGAVSAAAGFAADFVPTATYATVGARSAALRSTDPHWSAFGPSERSTIGSVMPLADTHARDLSVIPAPQATFDSQGRPLLVDATETVAITGATESLAEYYLADGTAALLPAWDLTGGGRTWVQIAVADKYLVAAD